MFRFKLRTLLVATALVGLFLGLQVYIQNKAKWFEKEIRSSSVRDQGRLILDAEVGRSRSVLVRRRSGEAFMVFKLVPANLVDIVLVRRKCKVWFYTTGENGVLMHHRHTYRINIFGERCELAQSH